MVVCFASALETSQFAVEGVDEGASGLSANGGERVQHPLVSHAFPGHRAQRVHEALSYYLFQAVPCAQMYPPFQFGCAAGLCLTGLWSVRGWTLICCSETRGFCHCGASGSEGHRGVLEWVQNRCGQWQSIPGTYKRLCVLFERRFLEY